MGLGFGAGWEGGGGVLRLETGFGFLDRKGVKLGLGLLELID